MEQKPIDIEQIKSVFFMGIAGDGMSALAQYLADAGKEISGSDRQFSAGGRKSIRRLQLEKKGISCFPQDTSGLHSRIDLMVVSTAIEPQVPEYQKACLLGIPIIKRSDMLAAVSRTKKTIAVGGTSGKSTVAAMIFHSMKQNNCHPSLITGAGLIDLQKKGEIGNAVYDNQGDFLIVEADESDGSIIKYSPEIGLILNIDKDHKEIEELQELFQIFAGRSKHIIVNGRQKNCRTIESEDKVAFGFQSSNDLFISNFRQEEFSIHFEVNRIAFRLRQIGKHNAENAAAAAAACRQAGISIADTASALKSYSGIYRRHQILLHTPELSIIDDYAHNPAKLAASASACCLPQRRLLLWFQPHGFQPTKFMRKEFVKKISEVLRPNDEIFLSEIYYAGGTTSKDISSKDLCNDLLAKGVRACFVENRNDLPTVLANRLQSGDIILLTGARDPSLSDFAGFVTQTLIKNKDEV